MDHVQGFGRSQEILFPAKIDDYIEEENLVRFIEAFVALLDLTLLGFVHAETKTTGRPPYNPADLLKLYIYGYLNCIRSSRKLEKETHINVEVMWLLKKQTPDHKTIADFRKNNPDSIKKVFKQFVFFCKELGLYGGEVVAIDGSKFKAVNSKKRNFNEDKLIKKLKDIEEKIKQLEDRKSEYQELLKKLEETGEKQVSLTDPDSRMMMNNQKFDVCYNVQTTIDDKNNLIVDYEVTNDVNDMKQLNEMREKVKENKDVVKKRNCMSEHPFGTIKRGFNQGYFLLKGLKKVGGEMGFTMLAYNMRRVINILGVSKLMKNMNVG